MAEPDEPLPELGYLDGSDAPAHAEAPPPEPASEAASPPIELARPVRRAEPAPEPEAEPGPEPEPGPASPAPAEPAPELVSPPRLTAAEPPPPTLAQGVGMVLSPTLAVLVAIPAMFLPGSWRRRLGLDRIPRGVGTVLGCLIAGVAIILTAKVFYLQYLAALQAERMAALRHIAEKSAEAGQLSYGPMMMIGLDSYIGFLLSAKGLILLYLFGETLLRGAVTAGGIYVPTLPLWLIDAAGRGISALVERHRLGPLVVDEISRGPGGLLRRIATCRDRGWSRQTTISFEERFYLVTGSGNLHEGTRRFVYTVDLAPEGRIIRQFVGYAPDALVPLGRRKIEKLP